MSEEFPGLSKCIHTLYIEIRLNAQKAKFNNRQDAVFAPAALILKYRQDAAQRLWALKPIQSQFKIYQLFRCDWGKCSASILYQENKNK